MKYWLTITLLLTTLNASANLMVNPDFSLGADGLDFWEAYDVPSASVLDPSVFVTATEGTAMVAGYSTGETAFYQTFGVGALASGSYAWSADISNIQDTSGFMFVKVFTAGDFGQFNGAKFQFPTLLNGTMALTYEHDATDLVQFGFSGLSATTGFDITNLSLTVVPEPSTVGLCTSALLALAMRRRRS